MEFWRWVSIESIVFLYSVNILFRIAKYATISTEESVYIIGGYISESDYSSVVAEYKNDEWFNIGNLQQARSSHGAITSGSWTMVIGGGSADGPCVFTMKEKNRY